MPTGRDAELVRSTLHGVRISARTFVEADDLLAAIGEGAGAILVAEEAVETHALDQLVLALEAQPVWSDLPVIIFSSQSRNAEILLDRLGGRINVTIVERPIRITMLISAVRGALRARQRQYQTRDLLYQLEEADKQKDLFLATLSHELRTPLNSMLGWIQILRSKRLKKPDIDHALEVIERNARGQAEMISDILFVSRIITGKLEIKQEAVDLLEVITTVVEIVKPAAESRSLKLTVDVSGYDPAPIEGDAERLRQVFLNLLSNSIKFTQEGGEVVVRVKRTGSNVTVDIADNGQGIDPQFLPFIFERFRQADNTSTRHIGGLGLGLAIVRHLVELHGGQVSAQSEGKDQGSTFRVTLPVADSKRIGRVRLNGKRIELSPETRRRLEGRSLLLVEDDTDSREMLRTALSLFGLNVIPADSVSEAIDKLKLMKPDFVVSDIGLPGEDGYDLIRKVRELPPTDGGGIPAVALTGYVSVQDRKRAIAAGYQEHLPKPVDTHRLMELLVRLSDEPGRDQ